MSVSADGGSLEPEDPPRALRRRVLIRVLLAAVAVAVLLIGAITGRRCQWVVASLPH
jgi:hypothetical protein